VPDDRDPARAEPRDDAARAADHAGIDRLAGALVPALIAKLGTLNVGELEVHEGDWRIRLRRPAGAVPTYGRRATDRPSRAHPGHEQHGHAPATPEPHRTARIVPSPAAAPTNGSGGPGLAAVGPGRTVDSAAGSGRDASGAGAGGSAPVATSPAVGVFQPGTKTVSGTRVRAGDRLGVVDMLGVPQEVVAPIDGIVVGVIVDAGTAVEYGQELVQLEPAVAAEGR
jgi:biotin carboxyl carrier protein